MHYNIARIYKTLHITPAMAAGVTDRPWDVADFGCPLGVLRAEGRKSSINDPMGIIE
jgi:hypothetical protein